ncbi:hypothetical protein L1987_34080 [Smallanthus sonchifolius]|uniref:Uncharacterized protein n=1 Tax=Smallanthus sonchifolius TaxID=185202 RepID=A0ACB9HTJ8_9ASTR|nr:hypothetical protein L1987_34080 [Smallanthus sonchifolius]
MLEVGVHLHGPLNAPVHEKTYRILKAVFVHRWEAKRKPKVKTANVERKVLNKKQTVYMSNIPDSGSCLEHLMPSKEWEDVFLADFSKLRLVSSFLSFKSTEIVV